jgi:hypothetical protein
MKPFLLPMILVGSAAIPGILPTGESMLLWGPADATPEDMESAARAVLVRCRGYGFRGIRATVVEEAGRKGMRLSSDSGFTPTMKVALRRLTGTSGHAVAIRFPYEMTGEECEQYWCPSLRKSHH